MAGSWSESAAVAAVAAVAAGTKYRENHGKYFKAFSTGGLDIVDEIVFDQVVFVQFYLLVDVSGHYF